MWGMAWESLVEKQLLLIMSSVFISSLANTCHSLGDHHSHLALWWLLFQAGWAGPSKFHNSSNKTAETYCGLCAKSLISSSVMGCNHDHSHFTDVVTEVKGAL